VTVYGASGIGGVLPVLQTPFLDDDTIDEAALGSEIEWVLQCGADGVTVAMVSEVLRLDHDERRELASQVCAMTAGRGLVVISVGAESTAVATRLARHAEAVGASAVMAIPPLSVHLDGTALESYYDAIMAAVDIPVVVQDASAYVGGAVPIAVMASLQRRYDHRLYFKPEAQPIGPQLSALLDATGGKARAFDGSGGIALIDTYRRGIIGSMPGADLCWAIIAIWKALEQDDYDTAYRISMPLSALLATQSTLNSYVVIEKHLLARQGIFTNTRCRGPIDFDLDAATRLQVNTLFEILEAACRSGDRPEAGRGRTRSTLREGAEALDPD
jgi:dihydrodipicolinate synthase/N-acetylneuraminate lyase